MVIFFKTKIPSDAVLFPPKIPCYKSLSIVEYRKETPKHEKRSGDRAEKIEKEVIRSRDFDDRRCRFVSRTLGILF